MPPKHLTVWLYYTAVAFYATESLIRLMGIEWSTPLSEPESRPPKLLLLLSLLLDKLDKKKHGDADFAQPFATLLIRKILGVRKYIFKKQTAETAVCDRKTYWWCKLWQNNANRGFWPQQKKVQLETQDDKTISQHCFCSAGCVSPFLLLGISIVLYAFITDYRP